MKNAVAWSQCLLASYGSFLAACGFEYDGPVGLVGFDPAIHPENCRAPFTAAGQALAVFRQKRAGGLSKSRFFARIPIFGDFAL